MQEVHPHLIGKEIAKWYQTINWKSVSKSIETVKKGETEMSNTGYLNMEFNLFNFFNFFFILLLLMFNREVDIK